MNAFGRDSGSFDAAFDWRTSIKYWRTEQHVTQAELARRSGLSIEGIKAYESGRRRPSAEALKCIIHALGIPREDANRILGGAGYAIEWDAVLIGRYAPCSLEDLQREAESYPWPAYVTNQSFDVVVANKPFQAVFGVDLDTQYLEFGERSLLGGITRDEFARRLANWDEVVTFMCGLAKADPRWGSEDVAHHPPWLERPFKRLLEGNPARIRRLVELWQKAPPIPHRLRQRYRIEWLYRGEVLLIFEGRLVIGDLWAELHWNEWIPADSETWGALERIVRYGA